MMFRNPFKKDSPGVPECERCNRLAEWVIWFVNGALVIWLVWFEWSHGWAVLSKVLPL